MKKARIFAVPGALFLLFLLWTAAVRWVDVQALGPGGSRVGLGTLNGAFHALTGVHLGLYVVTDWLGLLPLAVALGFALLGLHQLLRRKSLLKVDWDILALGGFYLLVMGAYLFFEEVVINYRPILIDGNLEASYPSSTTLLALCVLPTARMQLARRLKSPRLRRAAQGVLFAFSLFMLLGRTLSGVHWLTDIMGGVLLSAALVTLYAAALRALEEHKSIRAKKVERRFAK